MYRLQVLLLSLQSAVPGSTVLYSELYLSEDAFLPPLKKVAVHSNQDKRKAIKKTLIQ